MKKILSAFFILFLLLSVSSSTVFSQTKPNTSSDSVSVGAPMRLKDPSSSFPLGQSHYYTLTLRGNGESLVTLKTIFINREEASISAVKINFPSVPQDTLVYQVSREPQCVMYKPMQEALTPEAKSLSISSVRPYFPPAECQQYREPDFQSWGLETAYQKANIQLKGKELTVNLPKTIKPNGSGSLVVTYRSDKIAKRDIFGAFKYAFETVKVNDKIQNLQIGVNTDPDYYLKDAKGGINYARQEVATAMPATLDSKGGMLVNFQFDNYYMQIGQGTIVKNASNLQDNESFTIKGMYADNKFRFYGKEILISIAGFLLVTTLALGALYLGIKKLKKQDPPEKDSPKSSGDSMLMRRPDRISLVSILIISFGSSLFIMLYSLMLYGLNFYFRIFQYYSSNLLYPLMMILTLIISFCIYIVFLFGPAVFIGFKKGLISGLGTICMTVFWLIIYGVMIGIFFFLFRNPYPSPDPVYPLDATFQQGGFGISGTKEGAASEPVTVKSAPSLLEKR